ncbi:hypothetical protein HYFRA_00012481 [Hymenoscyphus fraxineus]|uniref:Uncharacterized protein n=1 Tax=Hymenoscyphus fraxineus TaxID=746836 RepID=A0A9N9L1P5_9HELO|nr:hypothetical protein HYFRA_00012481 [Hymenoscyphus fraxineus]
MLKGNPPRQSHPWERLQPPSRECPEIRIPPFQKNPSAAGSPVSRSADRQFNMTWGEPVPLPFCPPLPLPVPVPVLLPAATALPEGSAETGTGYEDAFVELSSWRCWRSEEEVDGAASPPPRTGTASSSPLHHDSGNATVMTPQTGSSYVMVHKRAHSNGSSTGGSEHQGGYSVPRSQGSVGEWANGGEMEVEEDNYQPHDPNTILFSMYGPVPSPIPNPYSPDPTGVSIYGDSPASHEYGLHMQQNASSINRSSALVPNMALSPRTSFFIPEGPESPWTHMQPSRVPTEGYEPRYVAFVPSPEPAAKPVPEEPQNVAASFQIIEYCEGQSKSKKNDRKAERKSRPPRLPAKGRGKKPITHTWEHHSVVQQDGFALLTKPQEQAKVRHGVRKGKLDPDAAEKARKVRRLTACWNCWIQKVPCSIGKPCER